MKIQKKKSWVFGLVFLFGIFLIGGVLGAVSHCCEKRTDGAWCTDSDISECDNSFLMEPTACISTSYCKLGTCVNKRDGDCMSNVAQGACPPSLGFWSEGSPADIPQCQLGCCAIGDQAAFVTQTKCKSFASLYSIDTHFQQNIQNEISCIASAFPDVQGACVFEREFETTCKMISRSECSAISDSDFHEGFLCTADELATNCAVTKETTCVEGKDEVFFVDSCGNTANIYDSSKVTEDAQGRAKMVSGQEDYWTRITAPTCTLTMDESASTNTADVCGDCNYYEGSTCKSYDRNEDLESATYGDNVCRNLGCEFDADNDGTKESYLHGETWCADSFGATFLDVTGGDMQNGVDIDNLDTNLPGSRYFRMICYNGDVTVEPCADRRAEVCIQSEREVTGSDGTTRDFRSAVCRVNAWQTCVSQDNQLDCENSQERDCQWTGGGKCVPLIAPGFEFWADETTDTDEICELASTTCVAKYTKKLGDTLTGGEWEQEGGEECFDGDQDYRDSWGEDLNQMCVSLGDCKGQVSGHGPTPKTDNFLGYEGA